MRRLWLLPVVLTAVSTLTLSACSKPEKATPPPAEKIRDKPDFGGVTKEYVETDGVGASRAAAIDDAIQLAVKQVNGVSVDTVQAQLNIATSIVSSSGNLDVSSANFAQALVAQSKGLVSDFKIVNETPPKAPILGLGQKTDSSLWRIRIGANITKYRASADASRPRLIVAAAHRSGGSFEFGASAQSANDVNSAIQARLSNAISQTNRFAVLDHQADDEIQGELDQISAGGVNQNDTVRLGQKLAADLIVIPTVERMEYARHAQPLRLADRELVYYSGGARISMKVVNATTGQLVMSDSFTTEFPTTEPTTLGASVDVKGATERALAQMTDQFVAKLLQKTFPISVISLSGANVVLSQGGAAVKAGQAYRAVLMGQALTDPQTGQSLGRTEQDFGSILVNRSDPNAAYGVIQSAASLPGPFRPGMIELRDEIHSAPSALHTTNDAPRRVAGAGHVRETVEAPSPEAAPAPPKPDKKW